MIAPSRMGLVLISSALAIAMGLGCASKAVNVGETRKSGAAYDQMRQMITSSDRVSAGNTLSIEYSADPKVSGDYKVDFEGNIQMPYKVTVKAAGLKIPDLKEAINKAYEAYVKSKSNTTIEIKERSIWIEVRGEVKNSGRHLVRVDSSIEEIVTQAGGFVGDSSGGSGAISAVSRPDYLRIERLKAGSQNPSEKDSIWLQLAEYFSQYDTDPDLLWRGGETLFFQRTAPADADIKKGWHTVTVMGEVREPKEHPVLPNADLLTYISRSGGPSSGADVSKITVIHRANDQRVSADLLNDRMLNEIKAGDVIIVRPINVAPSSIDKTVGYVIAGTSILLSIATLMVLTGLL